MALDAYLTVTGESQGLIKGSVTQAGRRDSMEIYGWNHEVISPRDAASGLPTGKRQHRPVVVTKPVDRATPLLARALVMNETLTKWRLDCWRPSRAGKEVQFYTIELVDARVAEIRQEQLNNQHPENMKHEVREHISFVYQKIIWTFREGGITAEDDWESPIP